MKENKIKFAAVIFLLFIIYNPYELFGQYFFRQLIMITFLTIGVSIQMIAGDFDLSFAAQISASTILGAFCISRSVPVGAALLVMLLFHMLLGALKGFLMIRLRIPTIIMTLALQVILTGLMAGITGENSILFKGGRFYRSHIFGWIIIGIFLILTAATFLLLNHSYYGRYCRMLGENLELAEESGLNCTAIAILIHCFSSLFFFVGAAVIMLETSSGSSYLGSNYLYKVLAAAFIGGIGLYTGEGKVSGMIFGSTVVVLVVFVLTSYGRLNKLETMIEGAAIVISIYLQRKQKRTENHPTKSEKSLIENSPSNR